MIYPTSSPWGNIKSYNLLFPDFFYVSTDLQNGFLFSDRVPILEHIDTGILVGHSFNDDMYAFEAVSDAMLLVLSSKNLAWHIYRNYCSCSLQPTTFSEFFSYAKATVKNFYPSVYNLILSGKIAEMEAWVEDFSNHLVYPWLDVHHPFHSHKPLPFYVPDNWMDSSDIKDLQMSITSNDKWFRIYFSAVGIPYYLVLKKRHPLLSSLTAGTLASGYDILELVFKSKEFYKSFNNGLNRYAALMDDKKESNIPDFIASSYKQMVSNGESLEMLLLNVFRNMPMTFPKFSSMICSYLPEAIISPSCLRSALFAVEPIINKS